MVSSDDDLISRSSVYEKLVSLYKGETGAARTAYRNAIDVVLDEDAVSESNEDDAE